MTDDDRRPALRVISGDATPEELAALLAVVTARTAPGTRPAPDTVSLWARPSHRHRNRSALPEGPWRTSLWPR